MTKPREAPIVFDDLLLRRFVNWFTRSGLEPDARAPTEAVILRSLGVGYLVLFIVATVGTKPHAGVSGKGLVITIALVALVGCVVLAMPHRQPVPTSRRIALLLGVTVASAVLAALQPKGIWQAGPYFVVVVAGGGLERVPAICHRGRIAHRGDRHRCRGGPRQCRDLDLARRPAVVLRDAPDAQPCALRTRRSRASQAAEARAAAEAERGRLSREMHDVLAHSLSALALQLESARLLARDRDTDPEVTRALDQAHHLAASGLDEARRAIAAARGEEMPGPERLNALTEAFGEQSGITVTLAVDGEPRELPSEARLAIYRTAQEALTNVRRHATPERVEIRLELSPPRRPCCRSRTGRRQERRHLLRRGTGGGFGLSGMRERAELLGGTLAAAPTGNGFRVELSLPIETQSRLPADTAAMTDIRVLLADDQRLVRESLATMLGLLGGIELVATASDGEEACALVAEHEPEIVLMDLRMPRVDGIEATRRLREPIPTCA